MFSGPELSEMLVIVGGDTSDTVVYDESLPGVAVPASGLTTFTRTNQAPRSTTGSNEMYVEPLHSQFEIRSLDNWIRGNGLGARVPHDVVIVGVAASAGSDKATKATKARRMNGRFGS
jgi:hypothetical protein